MKKIASLCVLAYKRPGKLQDCLESLVETIDYPCEIIVNLDNYIPKSAQENTDLYSLESTILSYLHLDKISKVIFSNGENRGVGRSFQNCLGLTEGEYIFKIDTDLEFKKGWLSKSIEILENNGDVGVVGLFNYNNYNPDDDRFKTLEEREDCLIVNDLVSSIYGFKSYLLRPEYSPIPDDGLHQKLLELQGLKKMAITKEDYVTNTGFGLGKSTYVVDDGNGNPIKAETHDKPFILHEN